MRTELIDQPVMNQRIVRLMGNIFEIKILTEKSSEPEQFIDAAIAEIRRIEALLTTFDPRSQTNQVNANAGIRPIKVDREVFNLIERSIRISELTQGAFDISYGSLDKRFWNFDLSMKSLPDKETARTSVRLINYKNIFLDRAESTVFLKEKGMCIGFGGIGKGYAAEKAKQLLTGMGIESGIVNASGDLTAWGYQADGKRWTIGIVDPDTKIPFSFVDITNMSVATSGNYEKYVTINGQRYSHTIDPRTGFPVTGIKSVTILSPYAELSDAMATPIMVMGTKVGLNLINQMKGIACIIVDDSNKIHHSKNLSVNHV